MPLTAKQAAFVREYLVDLNASAAAERAGYAKASAGQQGHRLLKNAEISAAIQEAQSERAERVEIDQDFVLNGLRENYERAMQHTPVMRRSGDGWVETGEYKYEGNVANRALELIGKHLGMFTERSVVTLKRDPRDMTTAELEEYLSARGLLE